MHCWFLQDAFHSRLDRDDRRQSCSRCRSSMLINRNRMCFAGTLMGVSQHATVSMEDIAAAAPDGPRWFQLYILKDRALTADILKRWVGGRVTEKSLALSCFCSCCRYHRTLVALYVLGLEWISPCSMLCPILRGYHANFYRIDHRVFCQYISRRMSVGRTSWAFPALWVFELWAATSRPHEGQG